MTTLTPLKPKGQVPDAPQSRLLPRASRRRDKPQLSCSLCRRRKLKCDRSEPCQNCLRRGQSCTYPASSHSPQRRNQERPRPSHSTGLHDRVSELERILISQINRSNASKAAADQADIEVNSSSNPPLPPKGHADYGNLLTQSRQLSENLGRFTLKNSETSYVEGAHWSAILDKISEIKDHLGEDEGPNEKTTKNVLDFDGPELLFGGYRRVPKQEILAALPPRPLVDRLVGKCFDSVDTAPVTIHRPTFMKEYEEFWDNRLEIPVMWIGLLFAMMCVATQYEQFSPNESAAVFHEQSTPDPRHLISAYREKTIQCLVLGNYIKAPAYTVETLLLHLHSEYVRREDTQTGSWILLGMIVRLALRSGYHIDGSHFPHISLFQAEMRRRIWMVISILDVFTSAQIGLPRMIKDSQCDSGAPRNLLDEDLDENMTELRIARPDTAQTAVLYFEAKNRIIRIFGMVFDLTSSAAPCSYEEIMALDKVLHDTYNTIPQWLTMIPIAQSDMDNPEQIMRRIYIVLVFLKSRCILHRKHMLQGRTNASFSYSRMTCIEAAVQILEIQRELDQEMQIGGRLYQDRWKVGSIVKHEFLLATTILCLDLDHGMGSGARSHGSEREKVFKVLNDSYFIWLRSSESSTEAQKAIEVLRIVLEKAQSSRNMESSAPGGYDESILQRPKPINFMPSARHLRGPMVLPPRDEARLDHGDLTAALETNEASWKGGEMSWASQTTFR